MIVKNKHDIINGNNALIASGTTSKSSKGYKYRELEKSKNQHIKLKKQKLVKKKAKILRNIVISFAVSITILYRYSLIYNMEKDISSIKHQISSVNAECENLKIGLLKYNNIQYIEDNAINKLNMIPQNDTNMIYIDLDKSNFKSTFKKETVKDKGIEKVIFEKINKLKDIFSNGGK